VSEGKVSPGDIFQPPPAAIWNNMVDAGRAWADQRFSNSTPEPTRPRQTDLIKLKNTSGALRKKGEILKIDGKAIEDITSESIWLLGVEPTADCYFGILKRPAENNAIEDAHVSGVCMARVNVTNANHDCAVPSDSSYVLQSSFAGPVSLLYVPDLDESEDEEYPIEKECVVLFNPHPRLQVIMKEDLPAAVNTKRDPSTAPAYVLRRKPNGNLSQKRDTITVTNRFKNISLNKGTYVKIEHIDGEWQPYAADCPSDESSSESI
jgi:hypothetical protein